MRKGTKLALLLGSRLALSSFLDITLDSFNAANPLWGL